jgi:N-acylneuraminate cytidylyltransferase
VTVRAAEEHPYWTFYGDEQGCLVHYVKPPGGIPMRRQDLPEAWCLNGAVYAVRTEWFLRNRSFLTADTVFYPMPAERSIDIDTQTDVERLIDVVQRMTQPSSNSQPNIAQT